MKPRIIILVVCLFLITMITSCIKDPVSSNSPFLRFTTSHVHIANQVGSTGKVFVESNTDWRLSFEEPAPDWVMMDRTSGNGNGSFNVTSTNSNNTRDYRFATILATAVNNSSLPPARITVVQYDSTGQVEHH